jgi:hypothetical protein
MEWHDLHVLPARQLLAGGLVRAQVCHAELHAPQLLAHRERRAHVLHQTAKHNPRTTAGRGAARRAGRREDSRREGQPQGMKGGAPSGGGSVGRGATGRVAAGLGRPPPVAMVCRGDLGAGGSSMWKRIRVKSYLKYAQGQYSPFTSKNIRK